MTREDIIRMARAAGFSEKDTGHLVDIYNAISAAEREACAAIAETHAIDREDEYVCDKIAAAIRARGQA